MTIDGDAAARGFADGWERLLSSVPGWCAEREPGAVAGVTTVPLPTLNGVWAYDATVESWRCWVTPA